LTDSQAITCPSCGGTLDVKGDEHEVRCPYCGNQIALSPALSAGKGGDEVVGAVAWVAGVPIVGALLAPLLVSATTVVLTVVIVGAVMCMVCGIFALTLLRLPRF